MDLQQVIEKRQSIRRYKEGDIPEADIRKMVEAASMAPSGKNIQNWHFIAIKDDSLKTEIADVVQAKNEAIASKMDAVDSEKGLRFRKFFKNFTRFFENAPLLLIVYSKVYHPSGWYEMQLIDAPKEDMDYIMRDLNPGMQSLGAAMENLTLKAVDMGYGSCWLTSANYAALEIQSLLKSKIEFDDEDYYFSAMMAMGIPEENQKSPKKKTVDEILTIVK